MAAKLSGSSGKKYGIEQNADINVTPFVDVMLVLLIIFMVTAPLMTSGVTVDLPKTNAQPLNTDAEPVTVSINSAGDIYIQDAKVDIADLVAQDLGKVIALFRRIPVEDGSVFPRELLLK